MFTNAEAITAAAAYVAENDEVFNAAYNANQDKTQGNSARTVRQALRNAVAGYGDQFGTVNLAATWLAGSRYLDEAVQQAIRNGNLPRGTTTRQAQDFLNRALGVRPQAQPVAEPVRDADVLRDEFVAALEGQSGDVEINIKGSVEALRDLLGL
jgi:hypothetical protein